eukprot:scaffold652_cov188-Chaetoceros_neogracile.AAC.6
MRTGAPDQAYNKLEKAAASSGANFADYSWISLNLLKAMLEYDHDPNFEEIDCVCTALCTLVELIVVCLENLECEENRI